LKLSINQLLQWCI